ncbi:hypothetical protein CDEF62S_00612 [Castellaniella defragrans]
MNENDSVAARVAELPALPMASLWALWDKYFDARPQYPNRSHLQSRLAYKQPRRLTLYWLQRHDIPMAWGQQRAVLDALS